MRLPHLLWLVFMLLATGANAEKLSVSRRFLLHAYAQQDAAVRLKDASGTYSYHATDFQEILPDGSLDGINLAKVKEEFEEFRYLERVTRLLKLTREGNHLQVQIERRSFGTETLPFKSTDLQGHAIYAHVWVKQGRGWLLKQSRRIRLLN